MGELISLRTATFNKLVIFIANKKSAKRKLLVVTYIFILNGISDKAINAELNIKENILNGLLKHI